LHGVGVYEYPDKRKYSGDWKNNKKNGKGTFFFSNGNKYDGEWKDDKMKGKGVYVWTNGDKFEGEYADSKRSGKGKIFFSDHRKYEGEWLNDKKHGYGEFNWPSGIKYKGEWQEDKMQGKGVYLWANGEKYEGNYSNSCKNGKGLFLFPDGRRYEGDWLNDKKHGYGEFSWPNGSKYKGSWKDDKQHGKGVYLSVDGKEITGEWQEGQWVKPNKGCEMTKCKNGHELIWTEKKTQEDLTKKNFTCDICLNEKPIDTGSWNCPPDHYDVCLTCKKKTESVIKTCTKGHELIWNVNKGNYTSEFYKCDVCQKRQLLISVGRWNCPNCQYDLCHGCRKPTDNVRNKNPEAVSQTSPKCPKGHELQWNEGCFYLSKDCPICKTMNKGISRWRCDICQEKYCVGCKKPEIFLNRCPLNHEIVQKELTNNSCDSCRQSIHGIAYRDQNCNFDICLKCIDQMKKCQNNLCQKPQNDVSGTAKQNPDDTKCPKGHELQWSYSCLSKGCPICQSMDKQISRWKCDVCQEKYCVGCKKPQVFLNRCPLNHELQEKELTNNTCDSCRRDIRGKAYRDVDCDYDLCMKCMESSKKLAESTKN